MPTPYEIMEAARRSFEQKVAEVDRDMRELERIVTTYNLVVVPGPQDTLPDLTVSKTEKVAYTRAAHTAEAIIRAAGRPFNISDMMAKLTVERGMKLEGKQPAGSLAAAMSVHANLEYIPNVGWWIKGIPWPPTAEDIERLKQGQVYVSKKYPQTWDETEAPRKTGPARSPEKQKLLDTARQLLGGRKEPMKFAELYDRLIEAGCVISGNNPRQALSVFLSRFSCFATEGRRGGWSYYPDRDFELIEAQKAQMPVGKHNLF